MRVCRARGEGGHDGRGGGGGRPRRPPAGPPAGHPGHPDAQRLPPARRRRATRWWTAASRRAQARRPAASSTRRLRACGSAVETVARLVVTHAHIDHFGLAGEVVRRSGGDLWMHRRTELDLAKYAEPDEAVDQRELMLADHGLYGPELTASSTGLREWMPVMPSIGRPNGAARRRRTHRGGRPRVGGGPHAGALARARLPLVAGRPAPLLGRPPAAGRVAARDVRARLRARPDGLLPGVPGAGGAARTRARAPGPRSALPRRRTAGPRRSPAGRRDGSTEVRELVEAAPCTVTELTDAPAPRAAERRAAALRHGRAAGRPRLPRGARRARAQPAAGRGVRLERGGLAPLRRRCVPGTRRSRAGSPGTARGPRRRGAPMPPGRVRFHQKAVTAKAIAIGAASSDPAPSARKVMIPDSTAAIPRRRCTTPV